MTVTLLSAAVAGAGFQVTLKKVEAGNVITIDADGTETIDGQETLLLTEPFESRTLVSNGVNWIVADDGRRDIPLPAGFIDGLTLENNSTDSEHDIDILAGSARDGDDLGNITIASTIVKQIDAVFAEGTGLGGLDTGTVAANSVYHAFAIGKSTDGTSDGLVSLSKTAPAMPSGFDLKRRAGTFATDSSGNIINNAFVQVNSRGEDTTVEVATTSGASIELTRILQDDVVVIDLVFFDVSTDTNSQPPLVQLGDSGGIETTGYASVVSALATGTGGQTHTDGFRSIRTANYTAGENVRGAMTLTRWDPAENLWIADGNSTEGTISCVVTGSKTTSGVADRVALSTPDGTTPVFDNGEVRLYARNYR